jgi:hypothetical protein
MNAALSVCEQKRKLLQHVYQSSDKGNQKRNTVLWPIHSPPPTCAPFFEHGLQEGFKSIIYCKTPVSEYCKNSRHHEWTIQASVVLYPADSGHKQKQKKTIQRIR